MELESTHIDNLIAKYLAGEASKDEHDELMRWMENSPENKKYFEGITFVHDKAVASHPYIKVDSTKAWEKVRDQMKAKPAVAPEPKTVSLPIYKTGWFRIAASFILIAGLSFFLYYNINNSTRKFNQITISSTDDVMEQTIDPNTQVVLNRNSRISYPSKIRGKKKELTLTGEAFIEVTHSPDTQLIVKAEETFIRDIGTSFNVKAYPESNTVEVYVESGEVIFYTATNPGISIKQGETGVFNKAEKTFSKKAEEDINVIVYKTKLFVFRNTKLGDALREINAVYQETITLENPDLANCTITVTFDKENTSAIAEIIAETLGLQAAKAANGYVLKGDRCYSR